MTQPAEEDSDDQGTDVHPNALDRARILQVLGTEMQKRGDAKFVDNFEQALDQLKLAEIDLKRLSLAEEAD